jgi:trk system potassium uptake protein TrkA
MKILICGAGQVGRSIARQLSVEENDVTVIDQSEELLSRISESLEVSTVLGHASHPDVIQKAGGADAEMMIAVTSSDEVNMVACQIAHSLFRIPSRVARVRNQSYLSHRWQDLYRLDHMPIDMIISPEIEVAQAIIRRLNVPGATDMIPYAGGKVKVIAVQCLANCPVLNLPMRIIGERASQLKMNILGVVHEDKFMLPKPDTVLSLGDEVYFVTSIDDQQRCMSLFGHEEKAARRVLIFGGGNIGTYIAQRLEESDVDVNVKVLEYNRKRAEEIANKLEKATVIYGSSLDQELLREAHVNLVETVIAVTNDDEVNVLSSLLAKRSGAQRAIALVNNASYMPLLGNLGIDVTVNPRETTVSTILQHIRRGKIRGVHTIHDGDAEIIEAEIIDDTPLVGKPIGMIELTAGVMVGGVVRQKKLLKPDPERTLHAGDRIIVVAMTQNVKEVEKIFSKQADIF